MIANPDGKTYVGITHDVSPDRRATEHNNPSRKSRGAKATRGRGPWVPIYVEEGFPDRSSAQSREWHLKRDRSLRRRLVKEALVADPGLRRALAAGTAEA